MSCIHVYISLWADSRAINFHSLHYIHYIKTYTSPCHRRRREPFIFVPRDTTTSIAQRIHYKTKNIYKNDNKFDFIPSSKKKKHHTYCNYRNVYGPWKTPLYSQTVYTHCPEFTRTRVYIYLFSTQLIFLNSNLRNKFAYEIFDKLIIQ